MSVTYFAYLCYPRLGMGDSTEDNEPEKWEYDKILPIQFSILHGWTREDKELY